MRKFPVVLSTGMAALALIAVLSRSGLERESEPTRTSVSPATRVKDLGIALERPGPIATQAHPPITNPEPMDVIAAEDTHQESPARTPT